MVDAKVANYDDSVMRKVHYASFRTDKAPAPSHSAELISKDVSPAFYDNLEGHPWHQTDADTLLKLFKKGVKECPNEFFLGTRQELPPGADGELQFGDYIWKTWEEVD